MQYPIKMTRVLYYKIFKTTEAYQNVWSINVTATDKQYSVTYAKVRFRSIFTIHYTIQPYNHYFVLTVLSINVVYQFEFSTSKLVRFINVLFFTSLHDVDKVCYNNKTNTYTSSCNIPAIYVLSIPYGRRFCLICSRLVTHGL